MASNRQAALTIKTLLDEGGFTQKLDNVTKSLKKNKEEYNLAAAEAKAYGSKSDELSAKSDFLTKNISDQKSRVDTLKAALEQAKVQYGENSDVVEKLSSDHIKAKTQLANFEAQLKDTKTTLDKVASSEDKTGDEAAQMGNKVEIADKKTSSIGTTFGKLPAILAAAAAALATLSAAFDYLKEGVQRASDLIEVQNVVDTTFKENSKTIDAWSKTATQSFGLSELMAKQFAGQMGSMLTSMGIASDKVVDMSTNLAGLAGDFASFYNLGHEEAWEKIRSGMSGETEPLKELGINMSVANLNAFALQQGLSKVYEQMSQSEQAQLRYNYLLSTTASAQGDFAKTSDSYANQQRLLKLEIDNLGASLGEKLLPGLGQVGQAFSDTLVKMKPTLERVTQTVADKVFPVLADGIESVGEIAISLAPIIENLAGAFGDFGQVIKVLTPVIKALADALKLLSDWSSPKWFSDLGFNLGAGMVGGKEAQDAVANLKKLQDLYEKAGKSYAQLEADLQISMHNNDITMMQAIAKLLEQLSSTKKYGTGTILNSPEYAVVGDEPEAIVPLNDNPRSKQLAAYAAQKTGIAAGGNVYYQQQVHITVDGGANPFRVAREVEKVSRELAMQFNR